MIKAKVIAKTILATLTAGSMLIVSPVQATETETEITQLSDIPEDEWLSMRDYEGRFYPATGVITELNEDNNTYIWVDFNGNEWEEIGIEDLSKGDRIALIMDNNGTSEIYDDFAVSIRYCGWIY